MDRKLINLMHMEGLEGLGLYTYITKQLESCRYNTYKDVLDDEFLALEFSDYDFSFVRDVVLTCEELKLFKPHLSLVSDNLDKMFDGNPLDSFPKLKKDH